MQFAKIVKFAYFCASMDSKRFSAWADLGVMAAILLGATLIAGIFAGILMAASGRAAPDGPWLFASYTVQFTLAVVAGAMWFRSRGGIRFRFGIKISHAPWILAGIVLTACASLVVEPLIALFPAKYLEQLNDLIGRGGWTILSTVVAAPILEEMFFRGLLLERLSRSWSALAAVVVSAAVFGIIHLNPPQSLNAFVIAVVMGFIYLQTRSLVPVIVIHAINNGLAYLMLELTDDPNVATREMMGNDTLYWAVYAVSAVILAASLAVLSRKTRTKKSEIALDEKTADE